MLPEYIAERSLFSMRFTICIREPARYLISSKKFPFPSFISENGIALHLHPAAVCHNQVSKASMRSRGPSPDLRIGRPYSLRLSSASSIEGARSSDRCNTHFHIKPLPARNVLVHLADRFTQINRVGSRYYSAYRTIIDDKVDLHA